MNTTAIQNHLKASISQSLLRMGQDFRDDMLKNFRGPIPSLEFKISATVKIDLPIPDPYIKGEATMRVVPAPDGPEITLTDVRVKVGLEGL